jgi:oligoribonuclease
MEKKLIWLDLEMTGLDPNAERIIEIFTAVTNEDLTEIIDGPNLVVSQPQEYIDAMDDWNQSHHGESGLIEDVLNSKINQEEAEQETLRFLREHVGKNASPLCGNTVWHEGEAFFPTCSLKNLKVSCSASS